MCFGFFSVISSYSTASLIDYILNIQALFLFKFFTQIPSSWNTLDPDLLRIDSFTPFSFQLIYHPLSKTFSRHLPKIVSPALP